MFRVHADAGFRNWIYAIERSRAKRIGWSISVLQKVGALDSAEAERQKVMFTRVTYDGHSMYRVEAYGDESKNNPAVYGFVREDDDIYIVIFGSLSDTSLAAMIDKGVTNYLRLKGGDK